VRINEAAIDWYAGGTNYRDVVKRAADEAAGQAFATDFSGPTAPYEGQVWNESMVSVASLRKARTSAEWLSGIVYSPLPSSSQLTALLTLWAPAPQGVDQADFLQCPDCYADQVSTGFDAKAATDALQAEILDVLAAAQRLIDRSPHVTRLFTTMDASEMTVDPQFVFNSDLEQDVGFLHTATNEIHCGLFEDVEGAERVLELSDGRQIRLPSSAWLEQHEMTELEYMDELTSPAAIVIEDLGESGTGTILADYRELAAEEAAAFNRGTPGGCSCATSNAGALGAAWLLLAGIAVRRRQSP
jgi:MYXO-CTERM domain-containing protein